MYKYEIRFRNIDLDRWYCFNDSSVKCVDQEELRKSYGGTGHGWAFGNTNAYMLMYRKVRAVFLCHFNSTKLLRENRFTARTAGCHEAFFSLSLLFCDSLTVNIKYLQFKTNYLQY